MTRRRRSDSGESPRFIAVVENNPNLCRKMVCEARRWGFGATMTRSIETAITMVGAGLFAGVLVHTSSFAAADLHRLRDATAALNVAFFPIVSVVVPRQAGGVSEHLVAPQWDPSRPPWRRSTCKLRRSDSYLIDEGLSHLFQC